MIDIAYVPTMCNHCDDAPCIDKGGGAIKKRDDGIVLIDPEKAKGRKDLVDACPYGHIWWNEEHEVPQIWPFDAHLIDEGWQQTRGQQSCPTGAMRAIKIEDDEMARMARDEGLEVMQPELGTKPRVYYRNLWRYSKCFIGGSISAEAERRGRLRRGRERAAPARTAALVAETTSDNYGDFKFDKLDEDSGAYTVEIAANGKKQTVETSSAPASISARSGCSCASRRAGEARERQRYQGPRSEAWFAAPPDAGNEAACADA